MQVKLDAFRALVAQKAGAVKAVGTRDGFCLTIGTAMLGTDAGTVRTFQNLTTLARFAKGENVAALSLDLAQMPKSKKRVPKSALAAVVKKPAKRVAAVA